MMKVGDVDLPAEMTSKSAKMEIATVSVQHKLHSSLL